MKIERIIGREIYDSRGWPTLQCEIFLENKQSVTGSVPSGASVGAHEAIELRDGGSRLYGKGLLKSIQNLERVLAPQFIGKEPNAVEMDMHILEIEGTDDKSFLGANTTLALSMALYKAQALIEGIELFELIAYIIDSETVTLPFPLLNVINGGAHADNNLRMQECIIFPVGAPTFRSGFEACTIVYHELYALLRSKNLSTNVGDEGGFAPNFDSDTQALDFLTEAIDRAHKQHNVTCVIALDVAASQFYNADTGLYDWYGKQVSNQELIAYYEKLVAQYPIYSIEDGLNEDDWIGWQQMTQALSNKIQIVGDDLFVTDIDRITQGINNKAATSVIIKPNQRGTVTEALQAVKLCQDAQLNTIISHRSGDTEDTFIADLAVGTSAGQLKAGACCRSEHLAKYNRLLAIEDILNWSLIDS